MANFISYTSPAGAKLNYHYHLADDPKGLLVYLDGDGMWGHDHPSSSYALGGISGIVAVGLKNGYNVLSVRTPDTAGTPTWWENRTQNAEALTTLLNYVGIPNKRLWLVGFSGGAQFITQHYVTLLNAVSGGSIMFGGGGSPRSGSWTPDFKSGFKMHWITGTEDIAKNSPEGYDGLYYAKQGADWYEKNGFSVTRDWPAGIDHDSIGFKFGSYIDGILAKSVDTKPEEPQPEEPKPETKPWKVSIDPKRKGVTATVNSPGGKTYFYVYRKNGNYWYTYTSKSGTVSLSIESSLKPGTDYRYEIKNSGIKALGSFRTKS